MEKQQDENLKKTIKKYTFGNYQGMDLERKY